MFSVQFSFHQRVLLGVSVLLLAFGFRLPAFDSIPRIVVRDGSFVEKETGKKFTPVGCNFIHLGDTSAGISGHATFCPHVYDADFVEKMMTDLSAHGLNTVRTFQAYGVGQNGIVQSKQATSISPGYLSNLINFLQAARRHGIHVIFTTDTWLPESQWLEGEATPVENQFHFSPAWNPAASTNDFLTALPCVRSRANLVIALIRGIRAVEPELLKVVFAWEIENECSFDYAKYPQTSRQKEYEFAGKKYDLSTDQGQQAYMDDAAVQWCDFNVKAIHQADPEAMVSLSFFALSCIGLPGPNHILEDKGPDHRVPVRPLALLRSDLSYVDFHLYAFKKGDETFEEDYHEQLLSVEFPQLINEAHAVGKPILVGETGIAARFLGGSFDRDRVHYYFDYQAGIPILRNLLSWLRRDGFSGALYWHYGWNPVKPDEEFPTLATFPEYEDLMRSSW